MSAALDLPAAPRGDVTLTMSHRTAARRVRDGEPVGDLGEALGALYLHDLVRDRPDGRPELSPDGVRWLAAHDELVERTRPTPRPTPELPPGWREDGDALVHRDVEQPVVAALLRCDSDTALQRAIRQTDAMLSLMRWEQGRRVLERAVTAQEQMTPRGRVGGSEREATPSADPRAGTSIHHSGEGEAGVDRTDGSGAASAVSPATTNSMGSHVAAHYAAIAERRARKAVQS